VNRIHIAIAEDDPSDRMWLKTILDKLGLNYRLTIAVDGEEARDFILKHGQYSSFPPAQPTCRKLSGLEVLHGIPDSAELPVSILTSSQRERKLVEQHFAPKGELSRSIAAGCRAARKTSLAAPKSVTPAP
jgi:CheY-like chemotaxis protein